jgi:hypothetical protein
MRFTELLGSWLLEVRTRGELSANAEKTKFVANHLFLDPELKPTWRPWFAWYPVRTISGKLAWRIMVEYVTLKVPLSAPTPILLPWFGFGLVLHGLEFYHYQEIAGK